MYPEVLAGSTNAIVLPLNGTWTGIETLFMNVSVRVPGTTLPPFVPTSLACDRITSLGLTRSEMT